jgi:hypothetical protein
VSTPTTRKPITATWETLVQITFGSFMGSLVLLLMLLYSGVPIV